MELPEQFSEENFVDAIYSVRSKMGVEGIFEGIDTLADTFSAFIEYGDDFYEYIPIESEEGEAKESDELTDLMITSYVKKFYFVIPAFILYMREQEAEYIDYISEFKVKPIGDRLRKLTDIDKATLHKIYEFEASDLINDLYLTLKYTGFVFENFDELLKPECNAVERLRNNDSYSHLSINKTLKGLQLVPIEDLKKEFDALRQEFENIVIAFSASNMQSEKMKWLGTSTELAYLFEQLAYRGYIDNPLTKDGEMNKTALAREVWSHIVPENSKEETFIIDLRGSRLSENSQFAKAMNSIPANNKNK